MNPLKEFAKAVMLLIIKLFFGMRFFGRKHLNCPGAAILTPNHVSWIDALLIALTVGKNWKFVASAEMSERNWLLGFVTKRDRTILVDPTLPFALRDVAKHLQQGGKVVIFPEGGISDTGRIRKFYDGVGLLMARSGASVIRCYIRGAEHTIFARQSGIKKLFWPIEIHFSKPEVPPRFDGLKPADRRKSLTNWLRYTMIDDQFRIDFERSSKSILHSIWEQAAFAPQKQVLLDASMNKLTYRKLVVGAKVLGNVLSKQIGSDEKNIAILLPNANATPLTLMALWERQRCPAILNFSSGTANMLACANLAKTRTLVTSRAFLQRGGFSETPFQEAGMKIVFLEDCRDQISSFRKLLALCRQIVLPAHGCSRQDGDSDAVILFTSGSEGTPKAVALTHANIMANIRQCAVALDFVKTDKVFNALPMFHSFGLTLGTLLPLSLGFEAFLYPTPLHYRAIPNFIYDINATVMLATNTFMNGYARRANPYDFRSLRRVFVGAEKLQQSVAKQWAEIFGVRLLEGYGATECSPCISMNSPFDPRPNTAGRILPGMEYKIEPVEGVPEGGKLFVKGPNVMRGYLNTEANAKFKALGGWYDTGDIVSVCADGFVQISGRLKRFAKVSGEMVSLGAVEESLCKHLSLQFPGATCAVVAIPDSEKGEMLVAVVTDNNITINAVREAVIASGATSLSIPRHVLYQADIPILGSGKTDYVTLGTWVSKTLGRA